MDARIKQLHELTETNRQPRNYYNGPGNNVSRRQHPPPPRQQFNAPFRNPPGLMDNNPNFPSRPYPNYQRQNNSWHGQQTPHTLNLERQLGDIVRGLNNFIIQIQALSQPFHQPNFRMQRPQY